MPATIYSGEKSRTRAAESARPDARRRARILIKAAPRATSTCSSRPAQSQRLFADHRRRSSGGFVLETFYRKSATARSRAAHRLCAHDGLFALKEGRVRFSDGPRDIDGAEVQRLLLFAIGLAPRLRKSSCRLRWSCFYLVP
jgi:hypothetical protein